MAGGHAKGASNSLLMHVVLEWGVQQAHIGVIMLLQPPDTTEVV